MCSDQKRYQVELLAEDHNELEDLRKDGNLATKKQLFNTVFGLFFWLLDRRIEGYQLTLVNSAGDEIAVTNQFLDAVARKRRARSSDRSSASHMRSSQRQEWLVMADGA